MPALELFEKMTVTDLARWLDLHPFDVVRVLTADGPLPATLRFDADVGQRVATAAGIETWWSDDAELLEDEVRGRALVRTALKLLLNHGVVGAVTTRADNLFRGLDPADQWLVRRAVNQLLRDVVLVGIPTATGLRISLPATQVPTIEGIVSGTAINDGLEALWS
jgi:hypothetical protein